MAWFFKNECKYDGCGIIFATLTELIQHIESTHIDFDPEVVQQLELEKPESMPLSYILRYSAAEKPEEEYSSTSTSTPSPNSIDTHAALEHHNYSLAFLNSIDSDSDIDDFELGNLLDLDDSDGEYTSEFIMRYGTKQCTDENKDKPFACPVPGCKKRYKNINGIKYHAKNGHKRNGRVNKDHKCHCGKLYKTAHGLKNHVFTVHSNSEVILPSTSTLPESLESMSLLSISQLPNNFHGLYENEYDCGQLSLNNLNTGTFSNLEMQSEVLTMLDEKPGTSGASNSANRKRIKEDDDFIDVGDAKDCVYPYTT